ncbi:MAG TPA: response regulator [Flavobacterium sp.]|jgi:CheY-like chemotaxis protein
MEQPIRILIVQDEMISASNISMVLTRLGYIVSAIIPRGEKILRLIKDLRPDIVLDVNLKGETGGLETTHKIQRECKTPIIYLTASAEAARLDLINAGKSYTLITKPLANLTYNAQLNILSIKLNPPLKRNSESNKEATTFRIY